MLFTLRDRLMGMRVLRVFAVAQAHPFRRAYPCGVEVDLRSPRTLQGVAAGFILLGFVADFRAVVPIAALGLLATFLVVERMRRVTWSTEVALLVVSTVLFAVGRAGWAWVLALLATGIAALAAAADVWIKPDAL